MYPGGGPVRAGVESFGFPAHYHDALHEFPICHVNALLAGNLDTAVKDPVVGTVFLTERKPTFSNSKIFISSSDTHFNLLHLWVTSC